ncbi:carbonate dehydratase, putative [Acanthamoeba castellanii str. Neff]|uniref:carbonic anhydrase n=1 Tax=Acanthamoeba castellanii (strain ATCC 30010 / Neff) TaxID=1257118 RepID=L8GXK3_ACACF|nr:carbonate dehydratase, putative [Acanthamoeba castellanii str. Neff]ELR17298.1 carbonate dehydratase, putative [Acanthamoeba castellanii str. Neff]
MQLLLKVGLAIALVVVLAGGALGQCAMWSYDEGTENGPEVWGDLCVEYAKCSQGALQAPVDIRYVTMDYNMGPLSFDIVNPFADEGSTTGKTQMVSSPHSLRMDWAPGSTVTGGPFEHKARPATPLTACCSECAGEWRHRCIWLIVFYLSSLAFHAPSEFTFQGYRPDLSVYLYHHTSKKQVAVAVISFNTSHASSGFLDSLIPYLPINTTSSYVPLEFDLASLVAESFAEGYYSLLGSLTSPPCTEDASYVLARRILPASPAQLKVFADLLHHNARPTQPLNGRRIKAFVPFSNLDDNKLSKEAGWIFVGVVVAGIVVVGLGSYVLGKAKKNHPMAHPEEMELRAGN